MKPLPHYVTIAEQVEPTLTPFSTRDRYPWESNPKAKCSLWSGAHHHHIEILARYNADPCLFSVHWRFTSNHCKFQLRHLQGLALQTFCHSIYSQNVFRLLSTH